MSIELEYEVSIEVVKKYSFTVTATDEEDAEEKAKELGNLPDNEIVDNFTGDVEVNAVDVVCNDGDYEEYVNNCTDAYNTTPLGKDDKWEEHYETLQMEEWHREVYLEENESDSITTLKDKKKFIKKSQEKGKELIKVKFLVGSITDSYLYLDIGNLRGSKCFYSMPFKDYIDNQWKHKVFENKQSLADLLDSLIIYDENVKELEKEQAEFVLKKLDQK